MLRFASFFMLSIGLLDANPNSDPANYPGQDRTWEFHSAAGTADTTAIWKEDPSITAWATGYQDLQYGTDVDTTWKTPAKALGPAVGDSFDIVCLGRGGQITMTFTNPIRNGTGFDFAVFENGFGDTFLELGWIEVSTDGIHFVRFPNFSYTSTAVGRFGAVSPTQIHGYGSKYRQGYGTPFDLEQLQLAYDAAIADTDNFSVGYKAQLEANFPFLDLDDIKYVRILDIVGDGNAFDCEGEIIYDPYPTVGSAGFDLDAVAVINEASPSGLAQTIDFPAIDHQRLASGSVQLTATASSGLQVSYNIMEGPATLDGSTLTFTGLGQVVVQARQTGDATYAAAPPVTQSFVVADKLQHIYLEPASNQLIGANNVQLRASSSSGLPVSLFIDAGPSTAHVDPSSHLFSSGSNTGTVTLRASQIGGESGGVTYAPAADVLMVFDITTSVAANAPINFSDWQTENSITGEPTKDSDFDGACDFEEYSVGTDPDDASDRPTYGFMYDGNDFILETKVSARAMTRVRVQENADLSAVPGWSEILPEIISIENGGSAENAYHTLRLRVPKNGPRSFWRIHFSSQK